MELSRKAILAALLPLLAACSPGSPQTVFDWGVNDRVAVVRPDAKPKLYAYRDTRADAGFIPADPAYHPPRTGRVYSAPLTTTPRTAAFLDTSVVSFEWPVEGRVISSFGTTGTGGRNDGINIATRKDAPIHAAASGTVTYAGDGLKNYGNLLLIRHEGGYVTAYAHADRLVVRRGDFVTRGQLVGYAGSTGDVKSPQLHFEIRHDTAPVNPQPLLVASNF